MLSVDPWSTILPAWMSLAVRPVSTNSAPCIIPEIVLCFNAPALGSEPGVGIRDYRLQSLQKREKSPCIQVCHSGFFHARATFHGLTCIRTFLESFVCVNPRCVNGQTQRFAIAVRSSTFLTHQGPCGTSTPLYGSASPLARWTADNGTSLPATSWVHRTLGFSSLAYSECHTSPLTLCRAPVKDSPVQVLLTEFLCAHLDVPAMLVECEPPTASPP